MNSMYVVFTSDNYLILHMFLFLHLKKSPFLMVYGGLTSGSFMTSISFGDSLANI